MKVHPDKEKRQDCADCLYPERNCNECINRAIPTKPQHGRKPDKVKPLAQYLAEYFDHELRNGSDYHSYCELFEQALDAYESTEQVKIRIERV